MKTRPIIFSGPMIRALLDGEKSQTRRVVKPQPSAELLADYGRINREYGTEKTHGDRLTDCLECPYGQAGDLLWVRETWAAPHSFDHMPPRLMQPWVNVHFASTEERGGLLWRPSIHMPRWASRLTLRITDVRVERVQEISGPDCVSEGVCDPIGSPRAYGSITEEFAKQRFWLTWDSINAKRGFGWNDNPWVWVIEFEVIHANVDQVTGGEA